MLQGEMFLITSSCVPAGIVVWLHCRVLACVSPTVVMWHSFILYKEITVIT